MENDEWANWAGADYASRVPALLSHAKIARLLLLLLVVAGQVRAKAAKSCVAAIIRVLISNLLIALPIAPTHSPSSCLGGGGGHPHVLTTCRQCLVEALPYANRVTRSEWEPALVL